MENLSVKSIEHNILNIQGKQVMIDSTVADLFGLSVKRINEQVKRNSQRFPESFCFQLSLEDWQVLKSQIATSKLVRGGKVKPPWVFTEHGIAMIATLLNTPQAVNLSLQIIEVFIFARKTGLMSLSASSKIESIEALQKQHTHELAMIWKRLNNTFHLKEQGIFFNDQIFDAYVFSSEIISSAKNSIVLIDNYIDETTLLQLSKRKNKVSCMIYTEKISPQLNLDLSKHNAQFPQIEIRTLKNVHDRFLIIDNKTLYHLGASLKDLGKRWFAFSQMDGILPDVMKRLE
jgi:hypothetical protein